MKRRAVSAPMPDGEGIPLLIQLASSLGQSRDWRAISFFEEVLKK